MLLAKAITSDNKMYKSLNRVHSFNIMMLKLSKLVLLAKAITSDNIYKSNNRVNRFNVMMLPKLVLFAKERKSDNNMYAMAWIR